MFYYFLKYLHETFHIPGSGVYQYISFRAAIATVLSLMITIALGKVLISFLRRKQIYDEVRDLGLEGQLIKKNIPTMGGIMIITATIIPTLCFAKLNNVYIILLIVTTLWAGMVGFLDDYIKVFKKNKQGLGGWVKIFCQVSLGVVVGLTLIFHKDVVVREFSAEHGVSFLHPMSPENCSDVKSTKTTIPFIKKNELDYGAFMPFVGKKYAWILYILVVIFIITSVSNGVNLSDGLDGLAAGVTAIVIATLAIFAYLSGNIVFSQYLNIMYIPHLGELAIFCSSFLGACVGFLWYNAYPAQIFMGDTGSLTMGAIIAVLAISIRKELLIPLLCGIFVIENMSVILQKVYFKYTKKKYGSGKCIFLMAPIHHHFQKLGYHESKIVTRFWIIGGMLAIFTLLTLKLR